MCSNKYSRECLRETEGMKLEEFPPDSMEKQKPQEGFGGKWVGAGEEPVWVPQKPSPPLLLAATRWRSGNTFLERNSWRDKGAESESSRPALGRESPTSTRWLLGGRHPWCRTLGGRGTARALAALPGAPCAREGPQLPHWSSSDPHTQLDEPALK